jgi:hypothetical protein
MDAKMSELQAVLSKLVRPVLTTWFGTPPTLHQRKQFSRMSAIIDGLETLLYDAMKTKGWAWVHTEQLWTTWTLEKFGEGVMHSPYTVTS